VKGIEKVGMAELLTLYRDPLFWLFPFATALLTAVSFLLFAGILTWIDWRRPAWAERYRIQKREGQGKAVVGPAFRHFLINSLVTILAVFPLWPLLKVSRVHSGELPEWWVLAGQFIFFLYLDDFLFYWLHRALHTKLLYKPIHSLHHRFNVPWSIAGHYLHPLEFILISMAAMSGPLLVGAHVVTVWVWIVFRQLISAEQHCGYELPWNPSRFFPFNGGTAFHDFHHARFRGNYAGFTLVWDRLFGTLTPAYLEYQARPDDQPAQPEVV
jgi:4-alpha-methyl-delta7-sterol-4alpha-methyl oxidase